MAGTSTVYQAGDHASRPAAGAGCVLYSCSTHGIVYRDSGTAWSDFLTIAGLGALSPSIFDAKGDLIVASAADTAARLAAGANGAVLVTASGESTGLKWRLNNDGAAVAPAVTDDSGDGYSVGSRWLDTTADKEYVCLDASVGAAVWVETTGGGGAGVEPEIARKAADEVVNNSSALQDDDDLLIPLLANEIWKFDFTLFYDSGTTPDMKIGFTFPAAASIRFGIRGADAAGADYGESFVAVDGSARSLFASGVGTLRQAHLIGVLINGANAGNLQLQWAQNTANASNTTMQDGSHVFGWQLA